MACQSFNELIIEKIKYECQDEQSPTVDSRDKTIKLPRGGLYLLTDSIPIQFGAPPETIKDCIQMGIKVPQYFLLPSQKFDIKYTINVAEFEFPAYYNFFFAKQKLILICSDSDKEAVLQIFQETLLGPKSYDEKDYTLNEDPEDILNLQQQSYILAKNPFNLQKQLQLSDLIEFILYDENNVAKINDELSITKAKGSFRIHQKGKLIHKFKDRVNLDYYQNQIGNLLTEDQKNQIQQNKKIDLLSPEISRRQSQNKEAITNYIQNKISQPDFQPPKLGITMLGNSHGFDPSGCTSGYVLWINGQGIMIDPPPFSSCMNKEFMRNQQIKLQSHIAMLIMMQAKQIQAGVFQKLLCNHKIEIITTETIMTSFVNKYSAFINIPNEEIYQLFTFKPVSVKKPQKILGASFTFHYTFHTIPCIGFSLSLDDKSMYFSGDTFYDPEILQTYVDKNLISQKRYNELTENIFNHDIVIHEAGIPPIHTPLAVLDKLSDEIKKKLYLVHVSDSDIQNYPSLKKNQCGVKNTIVLLKSENKTIIDYINLIQSISAFEGCSFSSIKDLFECSEIIKYERKQYIINRDTDGEHLYIILSGVVKIFSKEKKIKRFYCLGDYFGESVLISQKKRKADVKSKTNTVLLRIHRRDFIYAFGKNSKQQDIMIKLNQNRMSSTIQSFLDENQFFEDLSEAQKVQLELIANSQKFKENEIIHTQNTILDKCFLIKSGQLKIIDQESNYHELANRNDFVWDERSMNHNEASQIQIVSTTDTELFQIQNDKFQQFLQINPGIKLKLRLFNENIVR